MFHEINKIVVLSNGGLKVFYDKIGDVSSSVEETIKDVIHPDLASCISNLRIHVAVVHGLLDEKYINMKLDDLANATRAKVVKILEQIHIKSLRIVEKGDSRSVIIGAKREVLAGRAVGFNIPLIHEEDPHYDYAMNLFLLADEVMDEAQLYVFDGKKSQMDLFEKEEIPSAAARN